MFKMLLNTTRTLLRTLPLLYIFPFIEGPEDELTYGKL